MTRAAGEVRIVPGRPLTGRLRVPGDKSISHRALLLAALAPGKSRLSRLSAGEDVRRTEAAVRACGAAVSADGDGVVVEGGLDALREPDAPIDVGNSGTGIRLLAGWVAPRPWLVVLHGDRYVAQRPMQRVAEPLRLMGAWVDGRDGGRLPPLVVRGGELAGIDYRLPVDSAQVKGAVLLAGLGATGVTVVREGKPVRAHTEELLAAFGADVRVLDGGAVVEVRRSQLQATDVAVPGDPSQAAFWVVAACTVPGSDVTVEDVYVGRARAGFLDVLRRMGADIEVVMRDETTADITARHADLHGTVVEGAEIPALIDEIPVLAVAAAHADGVTEFRDAAELALKETDRLQTTAALLRAFGAAAEARPDAIAVKGGGHLHGTSTASAGDHRIAMAAAVAALAADGPSTVGGWEAVSTSYPDFLGDLEALRA